MIRFSLGLCLGFNSFFFFLFSVGPQFGPQIGLNLVGLNRAWQGESGPQEKNPFNKQAWSGPLVQARELGLGMKKPGPNPTRCHS